MSMTYKRGDKMWDKDHTVGGTLTGGGRLCSLEGCGGWRLGVRWPDGQLTWPCTAGISDLGPGESQIGIITTQATAEALAEFEKKYGKTL